MVLVPYGCRLVSSYHLAAHPHRGRPGPKPEAGPGLYAPGGTGNARAMPAPCPRHPRPKDAYSPRHARATFLFPQGSSDQLGFLAGAKRASGASGQGPNGRNGLEAR
eukprot:gene14913-biopygen606